MCRFLHFKQFILPFFIWFFFMCGFPQKQINKNKTLVILLDWFSALCSSFIRLINWIKQFLVFEIIFTNILNSVNGPDSRSRSKCRKPLTQLFDVWKWIILWSKSTDRIIHFDISNSSFQWFPKFRRCSGVRTIDCILIRFQFI